MVVDGGVMAPEEPGQLGHIDRSARLDDGPQHSSSCGVGQDLGLSKGELVTIGGCGHGQGSGHRSVTAAGGGQVDLTGLEQAEGALAHVGELVGDDRVQPGLGQAELDEAALGGLQGERLGATVVAAGTQPGRGFGSRITSTMWMLTLEWFE